MGALASIIDDVSADVVAALAAAGYPPLTPDASGNAGAILVGTAANYETTAPPRIIFEPVGSKFSAPDYASASVTLGTTERRNQSVLRSIENEDIAFRVRCWGAAGTGFPVDDYDVTRALYHQVRASLQKRFPGAHSVEASGTFTDTSKVNIDGREFVFDVVFFTPVLDALVPYGLPNRTPAQIATVVEGLHAPANVVAVGTDRLVLPDGSGSSEPGCS